MLKIENRMFQFIVLLRAISAIVITNAHYENIYPLSIIANAVEIAGRWGFGTKRLFPKMCSVKYRSRFATGADGRRTAQHRYFPGW